MSLNFKTLIFTDIEAQQGNSMRHTDSLACQKCISLVDGNSYHSKQTKWKFPHLPVFDRQNFPFCSMSAMFSVHK